MLPRIEDKALVYLMHVMQERSWAAPELVEALGAQFNEYVNLYGPGQAYYDPGLNQAAGRACGAIVPRPTLWSLYEKQGHGRRTAGGAWAWADKWTAPFTEFYAVPA